MYYKSSMEICWIQLLPEIASFLQDFHVIHNMLLLKLSLWSILLLLHQHGKHNGSYEVYNFQWKFGDEVCSSLTFSSNFRLTFGSTIDICNGLFLQRSFKALLYFLSKSVCWMTKKVWIKIASFYFVISMSTLQMSKSISQFWVLSFQLSLKLTT